MNFFRKHVALASSTERLAEQRVEPQSATERGSFRPPMERSSTYDLDTRDDTRDQFYIPDLASEPTTSMFVCVHACVHVCLYIFGCTCMFVCVCVFMCIPVCLCVMCVCCVLCVHVCIVCACMFVCCVCMYVCVLCVHVCIVCAVYVCVLCVCVSLPV